MDRKPLLCELHAHTTWSDGSLTLTELVDVYGRHGFDVLCITDHVLPTGAPYLTEAAHERYFDAIDREARRAREQYGLLLVPGVELTFHDRDADDAGHALALGLRSWIPLDCGFEHALLEARAAGAVVIAAHPHALEADPNHARTTRWFWKNRDRVAELVDRWELINRQQTFGWIAEFG
ncbi:MAG: PHP domain-containing protein, partial [Gaiellaceae bacterium]